uniref:Imm70 family immunity protein n=1 Tax=Thaumasiovibrio occultus TaxID=1891184 RepID=UPI000B35F937|nr:Imm70 family immunity protein [Thaumasiovibrio occultus]
MSVYLCIFDGDEELDGIDVGQYADFAFFREGVAAVVENGVVGSVCPTLMLHSDCDGEWTPAECVRLIEELNTIEKAFLLLPPVEYNSDWKASVAESCGIEPESFYDCFFDIDGEPLIERIRDLAKMSVETLQPILFQ